ncbi:LOW QUALITY PROTEIN: uncharacterized protein LOC119615903 [Lucilia sericata]|uniref:LOW QUALITY PROTEIN: uncharacterized protein LOC119615903 n=1 Tax=Lucilia sericata TaxID=13632 RepID=UPI0018A87145|nr:LOW QUALITY PROTEIN: uncharacterized protein LOC119615903 [Lucilia sericata]
MGIKWIPSSISDPFPKNVLAGGYESDGSPIYVARSCHEDSYLPVKVIPCKKSAYLSWLGVEYPKTNYELLVADNYSWQNYDNKTIPTNAIVGSVSSSVESIYIGRGHYQNSLTVGNILPSHGCLYIPFNGMEIKLLNFEILIYCKEEPKEFKFQFHNFNRFLTKPVLLGAVPFCEPNYSWYQQPQSQASQPQAAQPQPVEIQLDDAASSSNSNIVLPASSATDLPDYDTWVFVQHDQIPADAVHAGYDIDETPMYVARAFHNGDYIPAKAFPSHNLACIPFAGQEIVKSTFEYLTGKNYIWMPSIPFPVGAVVVNPISTNEHLYVGCTNYSGSLLSGKFKRSEDRLYITFGRREIPITSSFEILVHKRRHASLQLAVTSSQ